MNFFMTKLHIETGKTNTILRTVSEAVKSHEFRSFRGLAESMLKHIKNPKNGGVWLAAPQVGVNKRIIVVSLMQDYNDENYRTIVMINPVITWHSSTLCGDQEGCLSIPGETGDVMRWEWVDIEFFNIDGRKQSLHITQLAARIVQHEIDHLDGILFTDRILAPVVAQNTTAISASQH